MNSLLQSVFISIFTKVPVVSYDLRSSIIVNLASPDHLESAPSRGESCNSNYGWSIPEILKLQVQVEVRSPTTSKTFRTTQYQPQPQPPSAFPSSAWPLLLNPPPPISRTTKVYNCDYPLALCDTWAIRTAPTTCQLTAVCPLGPINISCDNAACVQYDTAITRHTCAEQLLLVQRVT